jgi:hypothetical protein
MVLCTIYIVRFKLRVERCKCMQKQHKKCFCDFGNAPVPERWAAPVSVSVLSAMAFIPAASTLVVLRVLAATDIRIHNAHNLFLAHVLPASQM